eukprot:TRINITY_DN26664_c0_g1_i2.p1 TRINITY_DN26664_c0_g1~~TRINITY_DN26664_c0_g1_i2.p1  ORF type:complete len:235 (+),score=29.97 TRINITY_DN26664_c0_g1_i2:879-1583(+)
MSPWGAWSACEGTCDAGLMKSRTRSILQLPTLQGAACTAQSEYVPCSRAECDDPNLDHWWDWLAVILGGGAVCSLLCLLAFLYVRRRKKLSLQPVTEAPPAHDDDSCPYRPIAVNSVAGDECMQTVSARRDAVVTMGPPTGGQAVASGEAALSPITLSPADSKQRRHGKLRLLTLCLAVGVADRKVERVAERELTLEACTEAQLRDIGFSALETGIVLDAVQNELKRRDQKPDL